MYYKTILPDDSLIVLGDLKPCHPAADEWETDWSKAPWNGTPILIQSIYGWLDIAFWSESQEVWKGLKRHNIKTEQIKTFAIINLPEVKP